MLRFTTGITMTVNFILRLFLLCSLVSIASPLYAAPRPESISVVMDNNYPPFVFQDGNGQLRGILIDQWRLWESKTGVKVRISAMDWAEAQRRMQAGEFDVIDTIFKTEQRKTVYEFSRPYQKIEVPVFFNKEISAITDIGSLKGFAVAVKSGHAAIELLKRNGVDNLLQYNNYESIIQAAKERKVNVFVVDKPPALYFLHRLGILEQFRYSPPFSTGEFHRAVAKGDHELLKLVEEGFSRISKSELEKIETTWYGSAFLGGTHIRNLLIISGCLGLVLLVLFTWNYTLKQNVEERAAKLKTAEESLLLTRFTVEHAADAIFWITADASIIEVNEAACRSLGYTREELLKLKVADIDNNYCAQIWGQHWEELNAKKTLFFESSQRTRDGRNIPVEVSANYIRFNNREYNCAFVRDISERKQMVRMLAESEGRLRTLVQTIPDLVWLKDAEGVYLLCNTMFERLFGKKEANIVGRTDYDFVDKELADFFREHDRKAMAAGKPCINEEYISFADDGHRALLETIKTPLYGADGELIGVLGIARDITEREQAQKEQLKLERQLLHSQKLESLGILSGGIAHDFNNLLQAVLGNLDLALMRLPEEAASKNNINQAVNAARQAAKLTNMMLAYSGKGNFVIKQLNLSDLVEENAAMLAAAISKNVKLELQLSLDLPPIMADGGQIQQVVMNLITNASESIGEGEGRISLKTGVQFFDSSVLENSRLEEKLPSGSYVFMQVNDTGCGMDRETLQRLFDPFFTTKFTGRGLGMSAVLGIVRAHRGAFLIESRPSEGTAIQVLFPVAERAQPEQESVFPAPNVCETSSANTGMILVVDDEQMIREVAAAMLSELGYETICAESGQEALQLFQEQGDKVRMVLLDQVMPGMGGVEVFRALRQISPQVKVLLASGFSEQEVAERFKGIELNGFIQKPFNMAVLEQELTRVMAGGS